MMERRQCGCFSEQLEAATLNQQDLVRRDSEAGNFFSGISVQTQRLVLQQVWYAFCRTFCRLPRLALWPGLHFDKVPGDQQTFTAVQLATTDVSSFTHMPQQT
jgi:hypothetical protein